MRSWKLLAARGALAALGGLILSTAVAQTPTPPQQAPNMPAPKDTPAEKVAPPLSTDSTGPTLSDKLEKSEGVIKPPPTGDAEMRVTPPVPNPGTTIVIPPPGTSPSDPIQPK